MSDKPFRFKEFEVHQGNLSHKLGIESCIFGAWVSTLGASTALDIGTGTGILSLIIAQKGVHNIHSIEVEENAFRISLRNFKSSPWKRNISSFHTPLNGFRAKDKYDLIVCNPPYHSEDSKSEDINKRISRNESSLPITELANGVVRLLAVGGSFACIGTKEYMRNMSTEMQKHDLIPQRVGDLHVGHDSKRLMIQYSRRKRRPIIEKIDMELNDSRVISVSTWRLLKDLYLDY